MAGFLYGKHVLLKDFGPYPEQTKARNEALVVQPLTKFRAGSEDETHHARPAADPEEAARFKTVREQVAGELPDLIARHHERTASLDQLDELLRQLKAAREAKGLSLADVTQLTGMARSALSKLETGQRPNPTVETLVR